MLAGLGAPPDAAVRIGVEIQSGVPTSRRLRGAPEGAVFLEARVGKTAAPALLRLAPIRGGPDVEAFTRSLDARRLEWRALEEGPMGGAFLPRPLWPLPARPPVLPPLLRCREKNLLVGAVCPGCEGPGGGGESHCPACGSPGNSSHAGAVAGPVATVRRAVLEGGNSAAAAECIPCLDCDRKESCYRREGDPEGPGSAAELLETVTEVPATALLCEAPRLSWEDWVATVSGEGGGRTLASGPEHGTLHAAESFLVRLDALAQILRALERLSVGCGHPHLGLAPGAIWFDPVPAEPWLPTLWTTRLRLLDWAPGLRSGDPAECAPPDGRPAPLVPPSCSGAGDWSEGRCLPGGGGADPWTLPRWDVKFLPAEPTDPPQQGTVVEFLAAGTPGSVLGRVDVAFQEVWSISVDSPARFREAIADLLGRERGRPMIRVRPVCDHAIADDLFAAGTLWLALLSERGLDLEEVARTRERLHEAIVVEPPAKRGAKLAEAAGAIPELRFRPAAETGARSLPVPWLVQSLDWVARMTGLVPGAFPGQDHAPSTASERSATYAELLSEVEDLCVAVRDTLFGASPEDAEIRAVLERFIADV